MPSYSCQAPDHESDHTDANHRFAMVGAHLVVPTKAARLHKPAEGSLGDPALRQNLEAFSLVGAPHNLQMELAEWTEVLDPLDQGSQVATVGPDELTAAAPAQSPP